MVERIHLFEDALMNWEKTQSLDFETKVSINSEGEHNNFIGLKNFLEQWNGCFSTTKKILQKLRKRNRRKLIY